MENVLIAIPNLGRIHVDLARQLYKWGRQYGEHIDVYSTQTRPLWVARNECVETFMESNRDWLVFIDSDVIPPDNAIELLTSDKSKPIVGALVHELKLDTDNVVKRVPMVLKLVKYLDNDDFPAEYRVIDYTHIHERYLQVDATGTQCVAIHRSVFDAIKRPWFTGVAEDFNFYRKARESNIDIFIDTCVFARHVVEVAI